MSSCTDVPTVCEDKLYYTWPHHISALQMRKGEQAVELFTWDCRTRRSGGRMCLQQGRGSSPEGLGSHACHLVAALAASAREAAKRAEKGFASSRERKTAFSKMR